MSERIEQIGIVTGKVTTYGGAAGTIFMGFSVQEWGIIIGTIIGVVGVVISTYFQKRRDKRELEIKQATIDALNRGVPLNISNHEQ